MNSSDRQRFKARAHALKPVVTIGNAGLTPAVQAEIELALDNHELIKIKIRADKEQREAYAEQICQDAKAEFIQAVGQVLTIYRKNPDL